MLEMNRACSIAWNAFYKLNLWKSSTQVIGIRNGVYEIEINARISDVDEIIVPDEYHIGAEYSGDYFYFTIFKDDKKLCVRYPIRD